MMNAADMMMMIDVVVKKKNDDDNNNKCAKVLSYIIGAHLGKLSCKSITQFRAFANHEIVYI